MPVTRVTWRDALEMPEDGNRYEAIGGELHVSPPPKPRHEWVSMNLVDALLRLLVHPGHGRVFTAPVGVEFPGAEEGVQPDVLFVSAAQMQIVTEERSKPGSRRMTGSPGSCAARAGEHVPLPVRRTREPTRPGRAA